MCNETGDAERGEDGAAGTVYRANYRSAQTQVQIAMQDRQKETYTSTFFYTGFRYLSITTTADVTLSHIQGISVGLDSPETGSFICDNEKLQRLYEIPSGASGTILHGSLRTAHSVMNGSAGQEIWRSTARPHFISRISILFMQNGAGIF